MQSNQSTSRGKWAVLTLAAAAVLQLLGHSSTASALSPAEAAPKLHLSDGSGRPVSLSDFRGKLVYLDFWASWCAPCQRTLPWMKQLQTKFGPAGLAVIAVNLDESRAEAEKALELLAPNYKILFDPSGSAAGAFNLPSMPTSYLIGSDGTILAIHPGFREGDERLIEAEISGLLSSNKPR